MITLLHEQRRTMLASSGAHADGEALWLTAADIEAATGWQWKPEGLCRGDVCRPVPPAARAAMTRVSAAGELLLDIAAMWRHAGHPVVHDVAAETWVLGTAAAERRATLETLEAPDFTLPDLDGRPHRLSNLRGRRVFLVHYDDYGYAMACTGDWDLVCCGHSHMAEVAQVGNVKGGRTWLVNPGTVAGLAAPQTWVMADLEAMSFDIRTL